MTFPGNADGPSYWPHYLPFPASIRRSRAPVPNRNAVTWPQSQWAPLYLPPGSPSFQPYSYTKNNVPLSKIKLKARPVPGQSMLGPQSINTYHGGPSGDTVALPAYGEINMHTPVVRQGWIPTGVPIRSGIPSSNPLPMPAPIATAGPHNYAGINLNGLALTNGYGALALTNCSCAQKNPIMETLDSHLGEGVTPLKVAAVAALLGGLYYVIKNHTEMGADYFAAANPFADEDDFVYL
jgi:hypothetical protein